MQKGTPGRAPIVKPPNGGTGARRAETHTSLAGQGPPESLNATPSRKTTTRWLCAILVHLLTIENNHHRVDHTPVYEASLLWYSDVFFIWRTTKFTFFPYILQPARIMWNLKIRIYLQIIVTLSSLRMRLDVAIFTVKSKTLNKMCFEWILDVRWKLLTTKTCAVFVSVCSFRFLNTKTKRTENTLFLVQPWESVLTVKCQIVKLLVLIVFQLFHILLIDSML